MSYLRDEFLEFCALSEFVITDVQNQVIDSIFSNFEEQKNQNVIMPNAGGKTNLTYLLSAFFASENNKVLAYTSEPSHSVNDQIPGQMPFINNVLNWLKLVSIKNPTNITFDNNSYDYIFIDVLSAYDFETMLMYGKEASNRKQEIDRQHYTIPNQRPKDKHCGKI